MYRTINFRLPARRSTLIAGAAVLAATAGGALAVPAAQAAPADPYGGGTSTAVVLRAGLDVSLLGRTVDVPVNASVDDVRAPADAKETALTVTVGHGVEAGRPVNLLRASVATAAATAGTSQARGHADLARAEVHVPGLPLLALVRVDALTATATCRTGHHPTASSTLAGVTVLGRRVALHAIGTTDVLVPGVGRVRLDLTRTTTTSATAAATALHLGVRLDPLSLGVAAVSGDITLVQATCRTPHAGGSTGGGTGGSTGGSTTGGSSNGGSTSGSASGGSSSGGQSSGGSTSGSTSGGSSSGGSGSGGSSGGGSTSGATGTGGNGSTGTASSGSSGASGSSGTSGTGGSTQNPADGSATGGDLAHTGASSALPYLVPAAGGLVAAGAGALVFAGRRRRANAASRNDG